MSAARRSEAAGTRKPCGGDLRRGLWIRFPRITVPLTTRARRIWAWGTSASYLTDFRVENRLELMYSQAESHGLTYSDIARMTAENPAKIFGLYPRKGVIQPGSDADLVVIRPDSSHVIDAGTQKQYVDYNPYQGMVVSHKSPACISERAKNHRGRRI